MTQDDRLRERHAAELARTNMIHQCATEEDVIQWLMAFGAGYRAEGMREMREALREAVSTAAYEWQQYVSEDTAPCSNESYIQKAFDATIESLQQSAALPSDYVMVPREATEEMLKAMRYEAKHLATHQMIGVYKVMLQAATGTKR